MVRHRLHCAWGTGPVLALLLASVLRATPAAAAAPPAPATATSITKDMWGARSQLGATLRAVRAAEHHTPEPTTLVERQPILNRLSSFARVVFHPGAAQREVRNYVAAREAKEGPLTTLRPGDTVDPRRYGILVAEKAVTLDTYRRTPAEVTEHYVTARGSVDGQPIDPRRIFVQTWAAVKEPSSADGKMLPNDSPRGKIIVLSPVYMETVRHFYAEVDALSRAGNDVLVMDHQWAGFSDGRRGVVDRGFGVARDVAAVTAFANQWAREKYPNDPQHEVILVGNSMGAGPGVFGAVALNDAGKIKLDGAPMPKGLSAVLLAPFFHGTPSSGNLRNERLSHVPGLRNAPLVVTAMSHLAGDKAAQARRSDESTLEDIRRRPSAMTAAYKDLDTILAKPQATTGRFYVIQSEHDTLADPKAVRDLVERLGPRASLQTLPGADHVLSGAPGEPSRVVNGVRWLTSHR